MFMVAKNLISLYPLMLASNKYTHEYIYECKFKVELQLFTYRNITSKTSHPDKTNDGSLHDTIAAFERPILDSSEGKQ